MKIAIIGAGFSGLAIAWHLLNSPLSQAKIVIFDSKKIGYGTSGIAAGLLHPYAGAHAKLNWRGIEGVEATKKLLEVASDSLKQPIILDSAVRDTKAMQGFESESFLMGTEHSQKVKAAPTRSDYGSKDCVDLASPTAESRIMAQNKGILRLALNQDQVLDFQHCAKSFPDDVQWLDSAICQQIAPGCALAPGLWIKKGLLIYSSLYLHGLWKACERLGAKFEQKTIASLKETAEFDITIVATGAETLQLPELASLPIRLVKGQVLELSWPRNRAPLACALNSHVYIAMSKSRTSCLVGATYEKGFHQPLIDLEVAQKELLPKAIELFPPLKEASILNCYAGMRAATPQHRPLMKQLSSNQWLLTGMGSKGLLYHALYAKELVENILREF